MKLEVIEGMKEMGELGYRSLSIGDKTRTLDGILFTIIVTMFKKLIKELSLII